MDYTCAAWNFPAEAQGVAKYRIHSRCLVFLCVPGFLLLFARPAEAQKYAKRVNCCSPAAKTGAQAKERPEESAQRFATRVETILSGDEPLKGEWGILVVDAKSGQVLL